MMQNSSPDSYTAYVIGLGRVGFLLEGELGRAAPCTHAGCFRDHKRTRLLEGYDIDPGRTEEFKKNFPESNGHCLDLLERLRETKPEIISICTSSSTHMEIMETIARASDGKSWPRGILLEKPVGLNLKEGERIYSIIQKMNIPVVVCHDRRFYPDFRGFHALIRRRGLGRLRHLHGSVFCSSFVKGRSHSRKGLHFGGPLVHDGTHLFDLMIYYAGVPTHVSGLSLRYQKNTLTEDTSMGTLFFENGVTGSFHVGGRREYFHFEMDWEWERAKLSYSHGRLQFLKKKPGSPYLQTAKVPEFSTENPYLNRLDHLIAVMENREENESSLKDGLLALKTIEAVYRSCTQEGSLVSVEQGIKKPQIMFHTKEVEPCLPLIT